MKKLLISSDNYLPRWDGIARFLHEVIPEISNHFEVTLLVPEGKETSTPANINKISVPQSRIKVGDFRLPKIQLNKINQALKTADLVFNQTLGAIGFFTVILARIKRKKVISFIHSIDSELVPRAAGIVFLKRPLTTILRSITRIIYNRSEILIVPSEGVDEILSWMRVKKPKIVVNLGTNTQEFKKINNKEIKNELGITNELIIGYHGRIGREKDLPTLLRAFVRIKRKYPNTKLLIIGSGINSITKRIDKTPGAIHVEATSEVNKYLSVMDIYVMPSLTETTCLSVLEAMSASLAVVSTPVGYVQDYITEGDNGIFFPKQDSFALSRQIELLINNPILRKKLGKNARRTVEKKFDWNKTAKEIAKILKNV